jgi:PAS domain S-box-containing protein
MITEVLTRTRPNIHSNPDGPWPGAAVAACQDLRESLEQCLCFERLLADLSAGLSNAATSELDRIIEQALKRIAGQLGLDHIALSQFSEDGTQLRLTHIHMVSPRPVVSTMQTGKDYPWYLRTLKCGQTLALTRLPDDLPPEATDARVYCLAVGLKAHLALPLKVGGSVVGVFGISSFHAARPWPEVLIQRLRLLGELLASALHRRRAEFTLRESQERFRLLADAAPVMVWISGADKLCTYFNSNWLEFTGRRLEQEMGDGWAEGVHPDDLDRCLETYSRAVNARQPFQMEYRLRRYDGAYRWILDTGRPEFTADAVLVGYIGSCIDITERKQAEINLRESQERLAHVSRVATLGELAASVAHELNQPLTAILSNAQAAQRLLNSASPDLQEVADILQDIADDDKRAGEVIRRLRGLLKRGELERKPLDLNDLIRQVVRLVASDVATRNVTLVLQLDPDLPLVSGDRIQLQQVILNLLVNGIDAMRNTALEERKFYLQTQRKERHAVEVAARDSGTGIAPERLYRIFEPFYTTKPDGLGIGLSISRSIIEAHGGRIIAANNPDCGATFFFTLPIATEATS